MGQTQGTGASWAPRSGGGHAIRRKGWRWWAHAGLHELPALSLLQRSIQGGRKPRRGSSTPIKPRLRSCVGRANPACAARLRGHCTQTISVETCARKADQNRLTQDSASVATLPEQVVTLMEGSGTLREYICTLRYKLPTFPQGLRTLRVGFLSLPQYLATIREGSATLRQYPATLMKGLPSLSEDAPRVNPTHARCAGGAMSSHCNVRGSDAPPNFRTISCENTGSPGSVAANRVAQDLSLRSSGQPNIACADTSEASTASQDSISRGPSTGCSRYALAPARPLIA